MLIEELYDALIDAGASEDKARAAARAVATYDKQFADIRQELTDIRGTLKLLSWMVGTVLALLVTILFKVFH